MSRQSPRNYHHNKDTGPQDAADREGKCCNAPNYSSCLESSPHIDLALYALLSILGPSKQPFLRM
jgi:hypothetical protein